MFGQTCAPMRAGASAPTPLPAFNDRRIVASCDDAGSDSSALRATRPPRGRPTAVVRGRCRVHRRHPRPLSRIVRGCRPVLRVRRRDVCRHRSAGRSVLRRPNQRGRDHRTPPEAVDPGSVALHPRRLSDAARASRSIVRAARLPVCRVGIRALHAIPPSWWVVARQPQPRRRGDGLDRRCVRPVVVARSGNYRVTTRDLGGYQIPKRPVTVTSDLLHESGRGIAYTRSPFAYLFERTVVPPHPPQ